MGKLRVSASDATCRLEASLGNDSKVSNSGRSRWPLLE